MNNFNFVPKEDGTFEVVYEPENPKPVKKKEVKEVKEVVIPAPASPKLSDKDGYRISPDLRIR